MPQEVFTTLERMRDRILSVQPEPAIIWREVEVSGIRISFEEFGPVFGAWLAQQQVAGHEVDESYLEKVIKLPALKVAPEENIA